MILDKTLEKRYYVNLNDVTAYNWDMLTKNNDYQFICKPDQVPDEHAAGVYQHLLFQFDALDLSSLKDRRDIALRIIDMLMTLDVKMMHVNELEIVSTLLRALIIKPERRLVAQIAKHLKSPDDKMQLSFIELDIKKYEERYHDAKGERKSIFQRAAAISKAMNGLAINVRKVSIVQFIAYELEAQKKN